MSHIILPKRTHIDIRFCIRKWHRHKFMHAFTFTRTQTWYIKLKCFINMCSLLLLQSCNLICYSYEIVEYQNEIDLNKFKFLILSIYVWVCLYFTMVSVSTQCMCHTHAQPHLSVKFYFLLFNAKSWSFILLLTTTWSMVYYTHEWMAHFAWFFYNIVFPLRWSIKGERIRVVPWVPNHHHPERKD